MRAYSPAGINPQVSVRPIERKVEMDQNQILYILIVVAILFWMWMRKRRQDMADPAKRAEIEGKRAKREAQRREAKPQSMPRIGTPGSITEEQVEALKRENLEPGRDWSFEEAGLVLHTVEYFRWVSEIVTDEYYPPIDIQNKLLAFILTDQDLRDYVRKWGRKRANGGTGEEAPEIPRNRQFEKVAGYIETLWSPDADDDEEADDEDADDDEEDRRRTGTRKRSGR